MRWFWKRSSESRSAVTVPDDWDFYPLTVDGRFTSIALNLAYSKFAPLDDSPVALWVGFDVLDPSDLGDGSHSDLRELYDLEDHIVDRATASGMRYVGRMRNDAEWELTFYGQDSHEPLLKRIATEALAGKQRDFRTDAEPDPEWRYYRDFLFPPPERMRWIWDRRVVEQLTSHGDTLTTPRVIDHCITFPLHAGIARFCDLARTLGFSVHEYEREPNAQVAVVEVQREDIVDLEHIHQVVMELVGHAEGAGGTYDGWGCRVVAPQGSGEPSS